MIIGSVCVFVTNMGRSETEVVYFSIFLNQEKTHPLYSSLHYYSPDSCKILPSLDLSKEQW